MSSRWILSLFALLVLPLSPLEATNTSKEVELRLTLHDGTQLDGRVKFKKTKVEIRAGKKKSIPYGDISTIGLVPPPDLAVLRQQWERRKGNLKPDDVKAWTRTAKWAHKRGLLTEAREAWSHILTLDPNHQASHLGLSHASDPAKKSAWVDAKVLFQAKKEQLKPDDHAAWIKLSRFALKHNLPESAQEALSEVLRQDTFNDSAIRLMRPMLRTYRQKTTLSLPLRGRWRASKDPSRHHQMKGYALFALDLMMVDESGRTHTGKGRKLADYFTFGAPFYAVADGKVIEVREGLPDNPIGKIGGNYEKHNGVSIDHGNGEISWYVHAKKGSIVVKEGQQVVRGQLLGRVGNSGGSALPHLHFTLIGFRRVSVPWTCDNYTMFAPDGTPLTVERAWPREGWTFEAKAAR